MALSLVHHTRMLKKNHHLIVVECGCMNEFGGGILNLAQIHENVVQVFAWYPLTLLPTAIDDIFAGQVHCRLFAMDTRYVSSSLETTVMMVRIQGKGWLFHPPRIPFIINALSHMFLYLGMTPSYNELPLKIVCWGEHFGFLEHEMRLGDGRDKHCTHTTMWRHGLMLLQLKTNILQCKKQNPPM